MQTIIPVPIHSGHHHPMTEHQIKIFLGGLIFLSILFLISFPIAYIRYKQGKYDKQIISNFSEYNLMSIGFARLFLHVTVVLAWTIFLLAVISEFISELIFN